MPALPVRARPLVAATVAIALVVARARPADACATCSCGDPTLTAVGVEQPYRNRVRLALEERFGGHTTGDDLSLERAFVLRSTLVASWAPIERLTVGLALPLVSEWLQEPGLRQRRASGLGDLEVTLRAIAWQDRRFAPHHLLSLLGGVKLPTGARALDDAGYPVPDDDQPGTGSLDPLAGAAWAWFGDPLSAFASVGYRYATVGRDAYQRGQQLGASLGVQLQPLARLALAASLDYRFAGADSIVTSDGRRVDLPDTGGSMLAATPSIAVAATSSLILRLAGQLHVADWLRGHQSESNAIVLSAIYDLR